MKVIKQDTYDQFLFETVKDASGVINKLVTNDQQSEILSDVFSSFYKSSPEIAQESEGTQERSMIESLMVMPEYKNIRSCTRLDDVASSLALAKFGPSFAKAMDQQQKHENAGGDEATEQKHQIELRRTMREGLKKAQEEAEGWSEFVTAWGNGTGDIQRLPLEQKMELAQKLASSRDLDQIAKMLGRLKNIVLAAQATTPVHGTDEIVDTGIGAEIARMLPNEMAKYSRIRTLFYKDMLERSLMVYNLRGVENLGSGPIVACLDVSASMWGERERWSKALVLALAFLAEKQKRDFALVTFEGKVMSSKFYPKGQITLQEKIEIAEISARGGGTNYYDALLEAFSFRKQSSLKPADIVFITDGECELTQKQLSHIDGLKTDTQMRVYGVGIQAYGLERCLSKFADNISIVDDLGNIDHCKGILSKTSMLSK